MTENEYQEEQWRVIEGYENYMVSNMGNVWSITNKKRLSPIDNGNGYMRVNLCSHGERRCIFIHRLVVQAFIGEIGEGLEVNHINHDTTDNRLTNLEIVTHTKNLQDRTSNNGYQFTFVESLPEDARPFEHYGNHEFEDYFISGNQMFQFIRENRYRVLDVRHYRNDCYNLKDINNKNVCVPIKALE